MTTEMTPEVPNFAGKRCKLLVVCGLFHSDATFSRAGFTKKGNWQYAEYRLGKTEVRVRIGRTLPAANDGIHFHVELSQDGWEWITSKSPTDILNRDFLQKAMAPLVEHEFTARIAGYFTATKDELPAFIQYTMPPSESDSIELVMTRGQYQVRGAPIHQIEWMATPNLNEYTITLESKDTRPC